MTQNQNLGSNIAEEKLRGFADYLVKKKNFQNLDQATQDMLVEDVYDRLEERVNAVILANIPPGKVEEFDKVLHDGTKEQLEQFCLEYVPNSQHLITESLVEFEKTYLGIK